MPNSSRALAIAARRNSLESLTNWRNSASFMRDLQNRLTSKLSDPLWRCQDGRVKGIGFLKRADKRHLSVFSRNPIKVRVDKTARGDSVSVCHWKKSNPDTCWLSMHDVGGPNEVVISIRPSL